MARPIQITFPAAVTTAICTAQTLAGAGSLTIDGTLLDLAATMQGVRRVALPGIQRTVSLTSTGDISGVNITITGTLAGAAQSETRLGPNSTTVYTTKLFDSVTSVTADAAVATAMSVGTGSTGNSNWLIVNTMIAPTNIALAVVVTATANVTVQDTPDDVQSVASPAVFNHPTLAALTASAESNYAFPSRAIRCVMNSSSGNGAFVFTMTQAGITN